MENLEIKTLIDTVMETCIHTSWMMGQDMKEQFYLQHSGRKFEPTTIDTPNGGKYTKTEVELNSKVALLMFLQTWNTGYYHELVDADEVYAYLGERYDFENNCSKENVEETIEFVMTDDQIKCLERLEFLYNESQIDYEEYKKGLLEIFPKEHVKEVNVLTGMYAGHTIKQIEIRNVKNLPYDESEDELNEDFLDLDVIED